jgi:hypothetical protein
MFTLALALGKSIKELMESMTTKEYLTWWNYYNERPFGELRADYRMGLNTQTLISPHLKQSKPLKDFILQFGDNNPTDEELWTKLTGFFGNGR